jgi:alcohol dehydrogenase
MRAFYLEIPTLISSTRGDTPVFPNLIRSIEAGKIRPPVAGVYPLSRIAQAQQDFTAKTHGGEFVPLHWVEANEPL